MSPGLQPGGCTQIEVEDRDTGHLPGDVAHPGVSGSGLGPGEHGLQFIEVGDQVGQYVNGARLR
ncbi:hypothetical protein OG511_40250 [Streptomyces sp. NBC_01453]|uniref:hypothetical protein n=1 Tax=unclassified Streptomyces TaxID=2593676 RepID=UPI002E2AB42A|nr:MULTISPECIES: hypothetical protein [unclassified Streptomyces]